jgi:hypothetical protein
MMLGLRRRFASWALAMIALQAALVFTAPLTACCASPRAAAVQPDRDCCPAGAHAPGECPLHKKAASAPTRACRVTCDALHGAEFLVGTIAVLPANDSVSIALTGQRLVVTSALQPLTLSPVPDSPPPRSL